MKPIALLAMLSFAQHAISQSITYTYDEAGNRIQKCAVSLTREMPSRDTVMERSKISIKKENGRLTINGDGVKSSYNVSLYSADGVLMDTMAANSGNVSLSLNDYPDGTYIVRIKDEQENNIKSFVIFKR